MARFNYQIGPKDGIRWRRYASFLVEQTLPYDLHEHGARERIFGGAMQNRLFEDALESLIEHGR
jgi:hypothetical protein